jgi:hypothetical protein
VEGNVRGLILRLSRHLTGGTEENHETVGQGGVSPGRDLNAGLP